MRRDGTGWRKGRTVEEADINAGVADMGGQGSPDLGVWVRGVLEVSIGGVVGGLGQRMF